MTDTKEGLEVVAYQWLDTAHFRKKMPFEAVSQQWYPLVRLSDATAVIDQLKAENERLQMQLAACGVIALANTPESACEARKMHPDYMSASCSDVANAVDREMELRAQLAEIESALVAKNHEAHDLEIDNRQLKAENERLERKNANQGEFIKQYQDQITGGDLSLGMLILERDTLRTQLAEARELLGYIKSDCTLSMLRRIDAWLEAQK